MLLMYDGISVDAWPDGVTEGLVYTDGRYANMTAAKTRFPDAQFQTISATGHVVADWIDCEPGCVWPPSVAADLFRQWQPQGCRGLYFAESTRTAVEAACRVAGVTPEEFGADWTNVAHINPGETQTQFQNTAGFDVSAIPLPQGVPPVPRTPTPAHIVAASCAWNPNRNGGQFDVVMVGADGKVYHVWYDTTPAGWNGPEVLTDPGT